jgi:hypothetical protein
MKTLKWSLLLVLVAGVGALTVMLRTHSPRTLTVDANDANEQNPEAKRNEPVVHQPVPVAPAPVRKPASAVTLMPDKTDVPAADIAPEPANMMRIRAEQVLAKVNDQAILLKHLVPLRPDEQEQAMTAEEYESRLNRAIEMELTFQAAAAQGMDLTPEQKKRVASVVQKHETALRDYQKQGITWSSVTRAQLKFEQRLTTALLLQQNLVIKEAGLSPASEPLVHVLYEQARSHLLSRLNANGNVSISTGSF